MATQKSQTAQDSETQDSFPSAEGAIAPGAGSATPWFYHMAFRRYWDHWHHVQTWLKASDYARQKADKDKNDTLLRLQGGFAGLPHAFYPPFTPNFFDAKGKQRGSYWALVAIRHVAKYGLRCVYNYIRGIIVIEMPKEFLQ